jgi:hypothetical protein
MAFCSKCGSANDDGTRFCVSCGSAFSTDASPAIAVSSTASSLTGLSLGSKISGSGSVLTLILFFLPWIDIFGSAKMNGWSLALQHKPKSLLLFAVPVTAVAVLWFLYQATISKSKVELGSIVALAGGVVSLGAMLWLHSGVAKELHVEVLTEWFWLSGIATVGVVVGALMNRISR